MKKTDIFLVTAAVVLITSLLVIYSKDDKEVWAKENMVVSRIKIRESGRTLWYPDKFGSKMGLDLNSDE